MPVAVSAGAQMAGAGKRLPRATAAGMVERKPRPGDTPPRNSNPENQAPTRQTRTTQAGSHRQAACDRTLALQQPR